MRTTRTVRHRLESLPAGEKTFVVLTGRLVPQTFRDLKAFLKKFKKAQAKDDVVKVAKLEEQRPTYSLAHIVRERYPTFIDSLRDLDDALCLIVLFSTLPTDDHVITSRVANCERLMKEFLTYVMRKRCLQKMFLSIKGIYYQAEILGQKITWIAPYRFKQIIPEDVDVRVMLTFLEFYEVPWAPLFSLIRGTNRCDPSAFFCSGQVLLHFTNYKLFHSEGLAYPPNVTEVWENTGKALALARGEEDEDPEAASLANLLVTLARIRLPPPIHSLSLGPGGRGPGGRPRGVVGRQASPRGLLFLPLARVPR